MDSGEEFELRYFECRGRGEVIRYILLEGLGERWKETSVPLDATWAEKKADTSFSGPFGSLPVLVHHQPGGKTVMTAQSIAISFYLGRRFNLVPKDEDDELLCLMLCQAAYEDMLNPLLVSLWSESAFAGCTGAVVLKGFLDRSLTPLLGKFSTLLGDKRYFCGDRVTVADFFIYEALDVISTICGSTLFGNYSNLVAFHERIANRENIRRYLDSGARYQRLTLSPTEEKVLREAQAILAG
jgi:glutathione S-transferase